MSSERNISSSILRFAGDVNLVDATITSMVSGVTFNVTNQIITLEIFEDLFSPFITGALILKESVDFANVFPLVGQEYVDLTVATPSLENQGGKITGRFYIYQFTDRTETAERSTVYKLGIISGDAIIDLNQKISRAYEGKISDIVQKLITDKTALMTEKQYNIEETKNKTKYISNFWSPVRNINFLLETAQNASGSPTYTFFENRDGYNFLSLDYLNSRGIKQDFIYNNATDIINPTGGSSRNHEREFKKITELRIPVTNDYLNKVSTGVFGSTMKYSDLTTKRYFDLKYSFLKDWGKQGKQTRLNKFPIAANNIFATYNSTIFHDVIATNMFTNYGDVSNVRVQQERLSRLKQAQAYKIEIVVAGRLDYTVGQKVTVTTFKNEPIAMSDSNDAEKDKLISGNYLISAINHVIDKEKHECHMELIKDSLTIDLNKGGK